VRLQAAVRGLLVRRMVRKMRMLLSSSLSCVFIHSDSPIRPAAPMEVEVQVWALPVQRTRSTVQHQASKATGVSFILVPAVVLDKSNVSAGCFKLHPSTHMKPAEALFPWDPRGHEDVAVVQIYILVSNLFSTLIFNNKGKPRCKRLHPMLCQIGPWQLSSSRTSWVSEGGGDVMGSLSWAANRLRLSCGDAPTPGATGRETCAEQQSVQRARRTAAMTADTHGRTESSG
jgi:hypothetical protein